MLTWFSVCMLVYEVWCIFDTCYAMLSCFSMSDSATLWTIARQAPLSMGFSKREYWSELPFPSPGHLPDPGIEPESPVSPALQADSLPVNHQRSPLALSISQFGLTAFQVSRISCGWQLPHWIVWQRLSSLDQVDQQRASHWQWGTLGTKRASPLADLNVEPRACVLQAYIWLVLPFLFFFS